MRDFLSCRSAAPLSLSNVYRARWSGTIGSVRQTGNLNERGRRRDARNLDTAMALTALYRIFKRSIPAVMVFISSPLLAQNGAVRAGAASPLAIGETFTIQSKTLNETRRINVYTPPQYTESRNARLPVLYMPDGGIAEDFLHVAGLVQVSTGN